ncbi:MAG: efflux RND transporter permease subunit, partial [Candidatus Obscuribacterales bacterium]|nr:efflux RND transporter permease subunit [Candidatus Obscuribacterales bacterium]
IRGRDLGSAALESQQKIIDELKLPPGYKIEYAGEFERARQAGERLLIVVPVTLALIFCLLYVAFDSAILSILAMSAVPMAASVAILILLISKTNLSISSGVGIIALFGLSIQNAVIVVSNMKNLIKTNHLDPSEAMRQAAVNKLNAVLIAALVAAVGLLPAAFATGIGSQSQKPFAIVISCGIIPATILTLLILPALAGCLKSRKRS